MTNRNTKKTQYIKWIFKIRIHPFKNVKDLSYIGMSVQKSCI